MTRVVQFALTLCLAVSAAAESRPNVLIISIDDLNDWTSCLGGHLQARTPNMDRLAKRGTLFSNAHCQAPVCTPSRASLITGLLPTTTGLYFLQPALGASKVAAAQPTLLDTFAAAGYRTLGAGKFVHGKEAEYYQEYGGGMGGFGPLPEERINLNKGLKLWDWGAFPEDETETPDYKVASWVNARLAEDHEQPFFLVAGFWRPHVPMYAPPKYFEPFPLDEIELPKIIDGDVGDLSRYAKTLTIGHPAPRHEWFLKNDNAGWKTAVQAYLASVAFVDAQVGRVLDALDASEHRDDTIVVLFSDHGWMLGEKERWAKRALWNDSTRVPMIIAVPGHFADQICDRPVGLIDLYPTLLDLAGIEADVKLDGASLTPLFEDPVRKWNRPALTTYCPGNHALSTSKWRYIHYADGSEELYNRKSDPNEWTNLVEAPEHQQLLTELRDQLPQTEAEPLIGDWQQWEIEAWREANEEAGLGR